MRQLYLILAITSFLVLTTYCGKGNAASQLDTSSETEEPQKVSICKDRAPVSFSLEKKVRVADITEARIAVSPYSDRIFVYGRSLRSKKPEMLVKLFTKDLEFVGEKVLLYGQGPGEMGATNIMSIDRDNIYISVNSNFAWNIYDLDLNFLRMEKYKPSIMGAFELEDHNRFFIDPTQNRDEKKRRILTNTFRVIDFPKMATRRAIFKTKPYTMHEEKVITSQRPRFVVGKNTDLSFFYREGYVYLMFCGDYHMLKVDLEGRISKNVVAKFEQLYLDEAKELEYIEELRLNTRRFKCNKKIPPASCTIPLQKGFIVTRRKDYHIDCQGEIEGDYFSYDLESKGKVSVPCFLNAGKMKLLWMLQTFKYEAEKFYLVKEEDDTGFVERWDVRE